MTPSSPALVTEHAVRRLPRWVLLLIAIVYVLPGLVGRLPWRQAELNAFGTMLDMAGWRGHGSANWIEPQFLGQAADALTWLPYWLGAAAIRMLPFWPADVAVRIPVGLVLALSLLGAWYAAFYLASQPRAQPLRLAFGGEAQPGDYARALADASLLGLLACLGWALPVHEAGIAGTQALGTVLMLLAAARLAHPDHGTRLDAVLIWVIGSSILSLSQAAGLALSLGLGWLMYLAWQANIVSLPLRRQAWWLCLAGLGVSMVWPLLLTGHLAWPFALPQTAVGLAQWQSLWRVVLWSSWPVGLLAVLALWQWRHQWRQPHVVLPLWLGVCTLVATLGSGNDHRALVPGLPGLACIAALALPTLKRSLNALIDWFALLFFTACAGFIWLYGVAMETGWPAQLASNVNRIVPLYQHDIDWGWWLLALLTTLGWFGTVAWRLSRHRPAIWKGLVLSAAGTSLCWSLLMSLWLPLLNHGMGFSSVATRVAQHLPTNRCVQVAANVGRPLLTALYYHGQLTLLAPVTRPSTSCDWYLDLAGPDRPTPSPGEAWSLVATEPLLRSDRDLLRLYRYRD